MRISPNYKTKDVGNVLLKWWLDLMHKFSQQFSGAVLVVAVLIAGGTVIWANNQNDVWST